MARSTQVSACASCSPVVFELVEAAVERVASMPVDDGLVDVAERAGGGGLSHAEEFSHSL